MRRRRIHIDRLSAIIADALTKGARRMSAFRTEWDVSGDCQNPGGFSLYSLPEANESWKQALARKPHESEFDRNSIELRRRRMAVKWRTVRTAPPPPLPPQLRGGKEIGDRRTPLMLVMTVRCRKCDPCRASRSRLWRWRAIAECQAAPRTWFGTITLSPEAQSRALNAARKRAHKAGADHEALDYKTQFTELCAEVSPELTKYLKRVRKQSRSPLRYLLVAEQHKSGLPHYHILIHEVSPDRPIRHKVLSTQWPHGFTRFKLIEGVREAAYVCKYLAKSGAARVRASQTYGETTAYAIEALRSVASCNNPAPLIEEVKTSEDELTRKGKSVFPSDIGTDSARFIHAQRLRI